MQSSRSATDPLHPGPGGFAHRGLHDESRPENSLAAFRAAIEAGCGIECDLQLSGCNSAIVFHDRDGRRLCGHDGRLADHDAETIGGWSIGTSPERVPTLTQLLELVAGRVPLLLELKEEHRNGERIAAAALRALQGYDGPVGVMSFSARAMRFVRLTAPDVRRGLVLSGRDVAMRRWDKRQRAQPQFLAVKVSIADRGWVQAARGVMPVYSWTARTRADAAKLARFADAPIWEGDGDPRS
ncbi:glycerophosphodiester phosphodiesterase family protein [Sphingomicrobium astaxanthinifaciens]|uniref:glycerophosphodiester phosphodiesterase family protein n=1 Tax=Sphingomicrobium astaxanthinifaciens TaxID=1227949 RepID=UPI001FCC0054|nr:glycerophosphodiester phosphodiesterase family protein [Sphingomicrobium astaxanthinifaciens]MCJ7421101.1 glycerophosphodiester phosphodiesterase [Sphingomicrobium astaxanthinifaciens]